ncbi:MAG: sigma-54-dependent Fis family transcriptional regulator [Oligoflexia bacterium]|nr:sigma-54-dependent Fis family transcriptional regulator [Oligoflexia bacterium]
MEFEIPNQIKSNGFRLNDLIEIRPMQGNKRTVKLNRTKLDIKFQKTYSPKWRGDELILPSLTGEAQAVICWHGPVHKPEDGRFLVKSLKHHFFKINGTWSREAWVSRGDKLSFGYNELIFKKSCSLEIDLFEKEIESLGEKIIHSEMTILLEGETGIGKSSVAKRIHEASGRPGEFVQLNLGALNRNLIESELFGHKKGSFTGANTDKVGAFEFANGGTIFLDEIDSLPLDIQVKLLLFLDNQTISPVGSNISKKLDVRMVFASGQPLHQLVKKDCFRKDLYFRLSSQSVLKLSSLRNDRQKKEDALNYFLQKLNIELTPTLKTFYLDYPWPGNLRQMKGHLEKKKIKSGENCLELDSNDHSLVSLDIQGQHIDEFQTLDEIKREHARKVFLQAGGHIGRASSILGISKNTLKSLVKEKACLSA